MSEVKEQIVRLRAADFDEAMAFLNEVFGEHHPHDFAALLPSIYQPTDESMACNHAVRRDGRIRAIVGLFPIDWQVGDLVLKVGGIGGVSTHRSVRGSGLMKALMTHCVERMKAEGFHASWLGGQRQRYGYFGYERCGQLPTFNLSHANLRHAFAGPPRVRFEPLEGQHRERLAVARRLHDAQIVHCRRGEFHRFLRSWHHQPHAALDGRSDMVGYAVANPDGTALYELLARDDDAAMEMARAWLQARPEGTLRLELPPTAYGLVRRLAAVSEGVSLSSSGNWQIFDWAATVGALLRVSARGIALADGQVRLGIEGYGTLEVRVEGGQPACARVPDAAPVTWHPFTAMRALFGPLPPSQVTDLSGPLARLAAWCPLPLGWPRQDGV